MINRRNRWREVQPVFQGRLGPSKAGLFKACTAAHNAPTDGIAPFSEAPTEPGWYVVKQRTYSALYWEYFSTANEIEAAFFDSLLLFYPYTPITRIGGFNRG